MKAMRIPHAMLSSCLVLMAMAIALPALAQMGRPPMAPPPGMAPLPGMAPPPGPVATWEFYLVPAFLPDYLRNQGVLAEDVTKIQELWIEAGKTSAESLTKYAQKMEEVRVGLWQETSQENFERLVQQAQEILKEIMLNRFKAFQQTRALLGDKASAILWNTAWFPAPGPMATAAGNTGPGMGPGMGGMGAGMGQKRP